MMSRIGSKRGFTLIEVLLTIVILVVGIIGILRAYATLLNGLGFAKYNIEAASLLRERLAVIEEKAVGDEGTSPGSSSGKFSGAAGWSWALDTETVVFEINRKEVKEGLEEEAPKGINELKLEVINNEASQPRAVSIVTYVDNKKVGN